MTGLTDSPVTGHLTSCHCYRPIDHNRRSLIGSRGSIVTRSRFAFSDWRKLWTLKGPLPDGSVSLQLTCRDATKLDVDAVPLGKVGREVPVQLLAEPAACGCRQITIRCRRLIGPRRADGCLPE
jgi:hypothetical protein